MASTKISALTATTSPTGDADYLPLYKASDATKTYRTLLKNVGGVLFNATLVNSSPADATTYYINDYQFTTSATLSRMYIPRAGKIIKANIFGIVAGTLGTAETSTIAIRLNNTTDTTISSTLVCNATPFVITNSALGIAVAENDYISVKWTTPTWVTNPTSVYLTIKIWMV